MSKFPSVVIDELIVLSSEYILLGPGLVREVLNAYDSWSGKDDVPLKLQELMMVLRIEFSHHYR
jgi:hypothetical protein